MADSHLLLEQPAHSAKEENLPLAHAGHGTAPDTPLQRLLALGALHAGQTGEDAASDMAQGRPTLPIHRGDTFCQEKKTRLKNRPLVQRLSMLPATETRAAQLSTIACGANGSPALLRGGCLGWGVRESHPRQRVRRNCSRDTAVQPHHPSSGTIPPVLHPHCGFSGTTGRIKQGRSGEDGKAVLERS